MNIKGKINKFLLSFCNLINLHSIPKTNYRKLALKYDDWDQLKHSDLNTIFEQYKYLIYLMCSKKITDIDVKKESMINLYNFHINYKNINYLPTGLHKIYCYYIRYNSYLPYTLKIIAYSQFNHFNRNLNIDKLPYSIKIIELFNFNNIKFNLINLNNGLNIYINQIYNDDNIQYNYYINSCFSKIKSPSKNILHLYRFK